MATGCPVHEEFDPLSPNSWTIPALEEPARRYPKLRLADGEQLTFHPNISFRGPQVLRVLTAG